VRIGVHEDGSEVLGFTREPSDVTVALPDVVVRLRALPNRAWCCKCEVLSLRLALAALLGGAGTVLRPVSTVEVWSPRSST